MPTTSPPLHDPAFWSGDPYPVFAELRASDPVHRYEGEAGQLWAITRHADVLAISKDPATFCSGKGVLLTDLTSPAVSADSIIYVDPPEHAKRRKVVSPSLSVRRVAELEGRVRTLVRDLLDAVDPTQVVDAVESIAIPVPIQVIAELIGVPRSDLADFRRWSDAMIDAASEMSPESAALGAELFAYIDDVVRARRAEPRDDLVSVLAHGEVEGVTVSDLDINMFVLTLLVAGNETTRSLIANSVEELLRWEAPIMSFCRTATRAVEMRGKRIAEGDHVLLCYQSANRDEEVFGDDAAELDVARHPNPHTSFGYAEHYCMGAGLARLEARVLFEELLSRWPAYELAGPIERLHSRLSRGVVHLPVVMAP